jgi:hypothetical protein
VRQGAPYGRGKLADCLVWAIPVLVFVAATAVMLVAMA